MIKLKRLERTQKLSKENAKLCDVSNGSDGLRRKRSSRRRSDLPLCLQTETNSGGSEGEGNTAFKRETEEGSSSMPGKEDEAVAVTEEMD